MERSATNLNLSLVELKLVLLAHEVKQGIFFFFSNAMCPHKVALCILTISSSESVSCPTDLYLDSHVQGICILTHVPVNLYLDYRPRESVSGVGMLYDAEFAYWNVSRRFVTPAVAQGALQSAGCHSKVVRAKMAASGIMNDGDSNVPNVL